MSAPDPQHRYRIGFDHPFQPFAWLDGQTPRGTLIERVAAVMAQAGLAFDWVPMTLEETEHTRRRTLSNREGGSNRQAVYRWVNRAYHLETRSAPDRLEIGRAHV